MTSIAISLAISACASHGRIPDGRYEAQDGQQFMAVEGERVTVQVFTPLSEEPTITEGEYDSYWIALNGEITFRPMTTGDAIYGPGGYNWYWRDGSIVRKNRRTGVELRFVASSAAPN